VTGFPQHYVTLGRISGVHGVRGWVKVHSFTDPRENVVGFKHWTLDTGGELVEVEVEAGRLQGRTVIAKLAGTNDRDAALEWVGAHVGVPRSALPALRAGEYYWRDLEGFAVVTTAGEPLGRVDHLLETGAHDVIVLDGDGRRLIPFVQGEIVREIDLDAGCIVVDWSSEYWEE
jgi:16S rRNA processing protein RimM